MLKKRLFLLMLEILSELRRKRKENQKFQIKYLRTACNGHHVIRQLQVRTANRKTERTVQV